jgi:hypothetical protein
MTGLSEVTTFADRKTSMENNPSHSTIKTVTLAMSKPMTTKKSNKTLIALHLRIIRLNSGKPLNFFLRQKG